MKKLQMCKITLDAKEIGRKMSEFDGRRCPTLPTGPDDRYVAVGPLMADIMTITHGVKVKATLRRIVVDTRWVRLSMCRRRRPRMVLRRSVVGIKDRRRLTVLA